jgi:hypothetical protein
MSLRSYICERCSDKMHMTECEYKKQSADGWLVYCEACKWIAPPKNISHTKNNAKTASLR